MYDISRYKNRWRKRPNMSHMLIMIILCDQIIGDFHLVLYNIYVFSKFSTLRV